MCEGNKLKNVYRFKYRLHFHRRWWHGGRCEEEDSHGNESYGWAQTRFFKQLEHKVGSEDESVPNGGMISDYLWMWGLDTWQQNHDDV